jgi:uncharacterized Zn-binding protein involved in type VI secretion
MKNVARGVGVDSVHTVHPAIGGDNCDASPIITATNQCSSDVFVNSIGAVRVGDLCRPHPHPGCAVYPTPLSTGSATVFVNGKPLGRLGDTHSCSARIITGSTNVFAG